jgi:hypothetical protein
LISSFTGRTKYNRACHSKPIVSSGKVLKKLSGSPSILLSVLSFYFS